MSIRQIRLKLTEYDVLVKGIEQKQIIWSQEIAPFLKLRLQKITDLSGFGTITEIILTDKLNHRESVLFNFIQLQSVFFRDDLTGNMRKGRQLLFSQLHNGDIGVYIIRQDFDIPENIKTCRPEDLRSHHLIEDLFLEYINKLIEWDSSAELQLEQ